MASTYYDSAGKEVVDGDVAYASDLNDINTAVNAAFEQVETDIGTIGTNQSYYADLSEKWATAAEDIEVEPGKYSAYHWAQKAEDDAVATAADRVQTGLDRTAAAGSALSASNSATSASGFATNASNSANAALGYANTAAGHASDASDSADAAAASALEAATAGSPIGSIVAFVGGYFTNGANSGFTNVIGNTAGEINTLLNADGWYVCNGAEVNNSSSAIFNGAGRYLPNLTDSRFLMGSTGAGSIGGDNSMPHTHTTASFTLTTNEIPSHTHNVPGTSASSSGLEINQNAQGAARSTTTSSVGGGAAHNHGATGAASATENRPLFLSCFYIMRVF